MKWKFWKKPDEDKDETIIKVTTSTPGSAVEIYVSAQTSDRALELYKKLRRKETK